jgi:hypothetical protein
MSFTNSQKKSKGVESEELEGKGMGPPLHSSRNPLSRNAQT